MKKSLLTILILLTFAVGYRVVYADLATNLVMLLGYDAGDVRGTNVYDRSGTGNSAVLINGATIVQGKILQGMNGVAASNQYSSTTDSASLRPTTGVTLALWFKCPAITGSQALISKPVTAAPWSSPFTTWLIRINSSTSIEAGISTGSYTGTGVTVPAMVKNTWYHVAMTYTSGAKILYFNGALQTNTVQSGTMAYAAFPVMVGADNSASPVGDVSGCIEDDVRVYSSVLTSSQILQIYKLGLATR